MGDNPSRIMVNMTPKVSASLRACSKAEQRGPREQAALLLEEALEKRGYLCQPHNCITLVLSESDTERLAAVLSKYSEQNAAVTGLSRAVGEQTTA